MSILRHVAFAALAVSPLVALADDPTITPAPESRTMSEDKAAMMVTEMRQAFDAIHEKYGRPTFSFMVLNDDQMKVKIAPGIEALQTVESEKSKAEADLKQLREQFKAEADQRGAKIEQIVTAKQHEVNRRVRGLEAAVAERKQQLDADEAAKIGKLRELDALILQRRDQLKRLNLEYAATSNDLLSAKRESVGLRAELEGERARITETRREREWLIEENIKKSSQLDAANQVLGRDR